MSRFKDKAVGLVVTLTVSLTAYLTSSLHPSFDILVVSIIFGMLVSNMLHERETLEPGVNAAIKVFLPLGVGLYGLQLTLPAGVKAVHWLAVAGVFAFTFLAAYFISKGFGLQKKLAILVGTGMSVCGASAIAVVAPLLGAKKEDTSIAIISVMTVGITGMLIYKFLPQMTGLPIGKFAFLSGTTLPMLGQVKVASQTLGEQSLQMAMSFKLLRVSLLLALAIGVVLTAGRPEKKLYIPWFMVVFVVLAVLGNLSGAVAGLRGAVEPVGRFSLAAALTGIGLSLDLESITEKGARPLLAAFFTWVIVVLFVYLGMSVVDV